MTDAVVCNRGQRALDLLAELVRVYDYGFPSSADFKADPMTTLMIVDIAGIVRRSREELKGGCNGARSFVRP